MKGFFKIIETPKFDVLLRKQYSKESEKFEINVTISVYGDGNIDVTLGYGSEAVMNQIFDSFNQEKIVILLAEMGILELIESIFSEKNLNFDL